MNNQNQNNFMDSRTLLAVVLVAVLFVGWQSYLKKKYGDQTKVAAVSENQTTQTTIPADTQPAPAESETQKVVTEPTASVSEEKQIGFENNNLSFDLTSRGMGLKGLTLKNHTNRDHEPMKLGISQKHSLFEMSVLGRPEALDFTITQKAENVFEGTAQVGSTKIRRTLTVNADTGALENSIFVEGVDANFPGLVVTTPEKVQPSAGGSFLMPSYEHQDFYVLHSGTEDRLVYTEGGDKIDKNFTGASVLGIGSQYFATATVDKSSVIPEARVLGGTGSEELLAQMIYKPVTGQNTMELKWISYAGGKSVSTLEKIDKDLAKVVDLGFFATIGRALLRTLIWLHAQVGNWGVAIILLTLMVRILVLPLNISTFKSTKKMQKLQPVIASLRERYKDDPQAMNREMMGIWKEHKVNPLGGCLPMLLQLPIFFALYRVLGQSIELYQAPFFGWIQDLSVKDPWYVLPVLLAISMYFQQKMTPTTMDPTQAKVMQFLPLIFALMMVTLPSGLTLYIFVNTLSGVLLQKLFMHDRKTAVTTKEAKA